MLDQNLLIFVNLKLFEQLETAHPKYFQSIIGIFLLFHFLRKKSIMLRKKSKLRPPKKSLNVDFVGIA